MEHEVEISTFQMNSVREHDSKDARDSFGKDQSELRSLGRSLGSGWEIFREIAKPNWVNPHQSSSAKTTQGRSEGGPRGAAS